MFRGVFLVLFTLLFSSAVFGQGSDQIRLNQVGFYTASMKQAIIIDLPSATTYEIVDDAGTSVFTGSLENTGVWISSGEQTQLADFSAFTSPGDYTLVVDGFVSHPFVISGDALDEAARAAWRYFFYNRAGQAIQEPYAEGFPRASGHPDDNITLHFSTGNSGSINSSKGWYDAGDYGKYITTANISTYTLLSTLEQYPNQALSMDLNIPESNNSLPDVVDEILWELDWMLTMQDPNDGGVYHKLSTTNFLGRILPEDAAGERFACGKNTNVTLGFAATMAAAYRILEDFDAQLGTRRADFLAAAEAAWAWAEANPSIDAGQCPGFQTGAYENGNQDDERAWAAVDLYLATGDISFYDGERNNILQGNFNEPEWGDLRALATISLLANRDDLTGTALADLSTIEGNLAALADAMETEAVTSPYRIAHNYNGNSFVWGSNGVAGNQAFVLLTAFNVFDDIRYLDAAVTNVDYILGRNATTLSLYTGFGGKRVFFPHHRISDADQFFDPIPGMVVGGPQASFNPDPCNFPSGGEAQMFVDDWCSFSTNEVTINWNAPMAFALVGIRNAYSLSCQAPTLPDDISLCTEDVNFPLQLDAGVDNSGTIQWFKDGVAITGATSPSFTISSAATAEGVYRIERDSSGCVRATEIEISMSLPDIGLGEDTAIATGDVTTLSTNYDDVDFAHIWYEDGIEIAGETNSVFTNATCGHVYMVEVIGANCSGTDDISIACDQIPFNGPHHFPGTVEAEDFDAPLVEGASYNDTDVGNNGNSTYRQGEDVDIVGTSEGDQAIGYIAEGEYLEYTVTVDTTGVYNFNFRVALGLETLTGEFHIERDGQDITGPIEVSYTNGWDEYQTIIVPDINLVAGTYVFSMVVDRSPFNYSWMNAELIEADTDNDGVADALDGCPTDPNKIAPGDCGCLAVDEDLNTNGIADCLESCTTKTFSSTFADDVLSQSCEIGAWTHFFEGNEIKFSIRLNGNVLDNIDVNLVKDPAGIYSEMLPDDAQATFVLDESWDVSTSGPDYDSSTGLLTHPVSVRFYISDLSLLETTAENFATANAHIRTGVRWFKSINGGTLDIPSVIEPAGLVPGLAEFLPEASMGTTSNGVSFIQLDGISGFSGGSALISTITVPLDGESPVELLTSENLEDKLSINVINKQLEVTSSIPTEANINVFNSNGQKLIEDTFVTVYSEDLSGLATGVYYFQILQNGQVATEKIIID